MRPIASLAAITGYAVLFLMGMMLGVFAALEELRERQLGREGARVEARVLAREMRRGPDVVTYEFEARDAAVVGERRLVRNSRAVPAAAYREAASGRIAVLYHPGDPQWNRPAERGYWWSGLLVGFGGGALVMAVAAVGILRNTRRRRHG